MTTIMGILEVDFIPGKRHGDCGHVDNMTTLICVQMDGTLSLKLTKKLEFPMEVNFCTYIEY